MLTDCRFTLAALSLAVTLLPFAPAGAEDIKPAVQPDQAPSNTTEMSAAQLFAYADAARDQGEYAVAEAAYQALGHDPDLELRTESRYRLAMMYARKQGKLREAAALMRRILDDKPDAVSVRLELARLQALMGNMGEARRELRAAQASGLPPEVEQQVRFFANALSAKKQFGGGFEIALAPSTNVNRATSSDTLGTVIGDFTLSEDAQAKSGIGLSVRGQGYYRLPIGRTTDILLRASTSGDLYRDEQFDDISLSFQAGPQWRWGKDSFSLAAATSWRWYGLDPYTLSYGATGNWQHPLDDKTQLRLDATVMHDDNRRNDLEDGERYSLAVGVDHAFSARFGGGLQIQGARDVAQDPGYSTASGGASVYGWRELGRTTGVLSLGYRRLEADARLFLYPQRRKDDNFNASISGTFRGLKIGTFAPLVRLRYERNWSTVEIYDYDRIAAEFGVVSAF